MKVEEANDLRDEDTYVKAYLLPERTKQKTRTVEGTTSPRFKEKLAWVVPTDVDLAVSHVH